MTACGRQALSSGCRRIAVAFSITLGVCASGEVWVITRLNSTFGEAIKFSQVGPLSVSKRCMDRPKGG